MKDLIKGAVFGAVVAAVVTVGVRALIGSAASRSTAWCGRCRRIVRRRPRIRAARQDK